MSNLEKAKDHLKRNWKKYALGAGVALTTLGGSNIKDAILDKTVPGERGEVLKKGLKRGFIGTGATIGSIKALEKEQKQQSNI